MNVKVNEYYDLFDIKTSINISTPVAEIKNNEDLPNDIRSTEQTNTFRGFSNWENFDAANPQNTVEIIGKHKAPQAINTLSIDDNGDIWCYPPMNVGVPFWNEVIFRNFDYQIQPHDINSSSDEDKTSLAYESLLNNAYLSHRMVFPLSADSSAAPIITPTPRTVIGLDATTVETLWGTNKSSSANLPDIWKHDYSGVYGVDEPIKDYSNVPLFLKFDMYPSRSKVIFSSCDKTRNPDIGFKFSSEHSTSEPIKLNLSFSASNPITDLSTSTTQYNRNLTKHEINKLLTKCYWCIEWIYNRPNH